MVVDAAEIKQRVGLLALLERDGIAVKRAGASYVCCCPIPSWKDVEPTGAVIYRLRNVIQEITGEEWQ